MHMEVKSWDVWEVRNWGEKRTWGERVGYVRHQRGFNLGLWVYSKMV